MKLINELRRENEVAIPHKSDSEYGTKLERLNRKFAPLRVPKALEKRLPFSSKTKTAPEKKLSGLKRQRAVVRSDAEKAVDGLLGRLGMIRKEKTEAAKTARDKKFAAKAKAEKFVQDKRDAVKKDIKKKLHAKAGMA